MGEGTSVGMVEEGLVGQFWEIMWQNLLKWETHIPSGKAFKRKILIPSKYTCKTYEGRMGAYVTRKLGSSPRRKTESESSTRPLMEKDWGNPPHALVSKNRKGSPRADAEESQIREQSKVQRNVYTLVPSESMEREIQCMYVRV